MYEIVLGHFREPIKLSHVTKRVAEPNKAGRSQAEPDLAEGGPGVHYKPILEFLFQGSNR